jgi:aldehyde:ferredoxin oxidoreductase
MTTQERIWNLTRAHFLERNVAPGGSGRDFDYPNARFYEEAIPSGPGQGAHLTLDQLNLMLDEYYEARGWGNNGNPSPELLADLKLDDVAANLAARNLLGGLTAPLPAVRGERYKPKAF